MFWRFGSLEDSLPVAATVWLNEVWILPVDFFTSDGSASTYPCFSFARERYSRIPAGSGCPLASDARTSASVEYPVFVFLPFLSPSFSKRMTWSCFGDSTLNS